MLSSTKMDAGSTVASHPKINALFADAVAQHKAGHLPEAEAAYGAILAISPGHVLATLNLGVIAATKGQSDVAIRLFDEAIVREPAYAPAHYNRAAALQTLGQVRDAIKGFTRVCALEPGHYDAHRALGFLWLGEGERGRSLDHFARTYELRRGDDRQDPHARLLTYATRAKLRHDAEQFLFLAGNRRDRARFESLARAYGAVAEGFPEEPARLSDEQLELLAGDYNTAIAICDAPELVDGAVNQRADADTLTRRFLDGPSGVAYFDELLRPQALERLRRYLLESTIWHDFGHISGFVAAYLEDGLACPLLLQIADELRGVFPGLLAEHPLSQAWAFKGLHARSAVDVHADDAAISLNFWITPTEGSVDQDRGGLMICRQRPPRDWTLRGYREDTKRIVAFLEQNAAESLVVPYRQNRAVLFESRLFHRSDRPYFSSTYENHRINLTLLFGRAQA
jgi:tetratricopeptide (TPR) repeat protein